MKEHKHFVAALDQSAIEAAIARAEGQCSGEIRVHIQPKAWGGDIRRVAERTFERLGMTKTDLRNGVLLFIASEEHRFVILGDRGIHERVGEDFWVDVAHEMERHFREHQFTDGIVAAIDRCGERLREWFPWTEGDRNELSNQISLDSSRPE